MTTFILLGADDPEMALIERVLRDSGIPHAYAIGPDGQRVIPRTAYEAVGAVTPDGSPVDPASITHVVECSIDGADHATVIDHHRPGDPGYGRPPEEFLPASSIGQVLDELVRLDILVPHCDPAGWHVGGEARSTGISWVDAAMTAAADHCLEAAYRGRCPGVDPDALMRWRAESRAAFQGRPAEAVLADITAARERLQEATSAHCDPAYHRYILGGGAYVADLRGESIPELPEAACREGIPYLATVTEHDGREKVVLGAASPELVERFLRGELVPGLTERYGDAARGFAGGYPAASAVRNKGA